MSSTRELLCQFNANNELVNHMWYVHQQFQDDSKLESCMDHGMWSCSTQSDGVFGTFDFRTLFDATKQMCSDAKWSFYKQLIPYAQVHYSEHNHVPGVSECIRAANNDSFNNQYLIINLSDYSLYVETELFHKIRLESFYQRFIEKIENQYFKFECVQFMPQQERMLQQVATTLANRAGFL